jgi:hypothetical protein
VKVGRCVWVPVMVDRETHDGVPVGRVMTRDMEMTGVELHFDLISGIDSKDVTPLIEEWKRRWAAGDRPS